MVLISVKWLSITAVNRLGKVFVNSECWIDPGWMTNEWTLTHLSASMTRSISPTLGLLP
jgi:hypothetical protein